MSYIGLEEDYSRSLLDGKAADIYGVRIMLSMIGHCFWNYYDAKEARG